MYRCTLFAAGLALAALNGSGAEDAAAVTIKSTRLLLEHDASAGQLVVLLQAESEDPLGRLELRSPAGIPVLQIASGQGHALGLSGLVVETLETPVERVLAAFPEGLYGLRARTVDGRMVQGDAALSHALLPAPSVVYPPDGSSGVARQGLVVRWVPDPLAAGYHVILEQDDNDGLMVHLPAGAGEFQVPDRLLAPGVETKVEVGVVAANGNITLTEVTFRTL